MPGIRKGSSPRVSPGDVSAGCTSKSGKQVKHVQVTISTPTSGKEVQEQPRDAPIERGSVRDLPIDIERRTCLYSECRYIPYLRYEEFEGLQCRNLATRP